ncbi:5'-AMP-activated protein kinase beta subunit, interation domain-containing protein [Limtongia smithiae]|uniref:5'-AMP-activated protein kinase beta subunit, interation domain-containing protein n=1 Tax=Limtongia smithiae TaxID=1125753 RepID=UPI0034CE6925
MGNSTSSEKAAAQAAALPPSDSAAASAATSSTPSPISTGSSSSTPATANTGPVSPLSAIGSLIRPTLSFESGDGPHSQHREDASGGVAGLVTSGGEDDELDDEEVADEENSAAGADTAVVATADASASTTTAAPLSGEAAPSAKPVSKLMSGDQIDFDSGISTEQAVPTVISWLHGGKKVYVTGTFTGWRKMIKLAKNRNGEFSTTVKLRPGTHRIRFVVDNELRCSDALPTATDSMGTLVNYIEVIPVDMPELEREGGATTEGGTPGIDDTDKFEDEVQVPPLVYTSEIPDIFIDPAETERYLASADYPAPPFLPPHLETVILNTNSTEKDDSSVLPIPNHVVLNHLATTSIKHNVLAVASVSRFSRKYVTQILYAPL